MSDETQIKKLCQMQWNSTVIVAMQLAEGSAEEKERLINDRIKKFHLYNTKQLRKYNTAQRKGVKTDARLEEVDHGWQKSLMLSSMQNKDLNYLRALFKQANLNVQRVVNHTQNKNVQFYFKQPFDMVTSILQNLESNDEESSNKRHLFADTELFQFRKIHNYEGHVPSIQVRVIRQPKVNSKQYLVECAKAKFIKDQVGRMELRRSRQQLMEHRSNSRSSCRSGSIKSSSSRTFGNSWQTNDTEHSRKPGNYRQCLKNKNRNRQQGKRWPVSPKLQPDSPRKFQRKENYKFQRRDNQVSMQEELS